MEGIYVLVKIAPTSEKVKWWNNTSSIFQNTWNTDEIVPREVYSIRILLQWIVNQLGWIRETFLCLFPLRAFIWVITVETSLCIILLYFVTSFALNLGEMEYRNVYFSHFEHYLGVNIRFIITLCTVYSFWKAYFKRYFFLNRETTISIRESGFEL